MSKLKELQDRAVALAKAHADDLEKYPDYDFPPEVEAAAQARVKELQEIDADLKRLKANQELANAAAKFNETFNAPANVMRFPGGGEETKGGLQVVRKSLGEAFVEAPEWTDYLGRIAPRGFINEKIRITSPQVPIGGGILGGFKDLVTGASSTSAGALVWSDVRPDLIQLPTRPLVLRDIVTNGQTTSDTIEYPRVTGYTNNAAMVAEATATGNGTGVKPESALTLEKVSTTVKTIAHWIPATKRALADAAQIRTIIDNFLRDGLAQELEDQMMAGDGTGENLEGIATVAGQSQAWDTDILTTIRKARTLVRVVGRAVPRAIVMHPDDRETLDLLQDNEGRYYFGGPGAVNDSPIWSMPVVECEACTPGTGYVGDFRQLVLWDREQAGIQVSDAHSDFFIRNLVAILAEMRVAFGCLRPNAIVEVDLAA